MQVGAVDVDEGSVETGLDLPIKAQLIGRFARIPGAAHEGIRAYAGIDQAAFQLQSTQDFRGVGAKDNAGADPREDRRLFVDRDRKSRALKQAGDREPSETRAQDG